MNESYYITYKLNIEVALVTFDDANDIESNKHKKEEATQKKEEKIESTIVDTKEKNIPKQFCWNCGLPYPDPDIKFCPECRAPLDEDVKEKITSRTEVTSSIKCWQCNGTTSGHICQICGAPLTAEGLAVSKEFVNIPRVDQFEKAIKVAAPQTRNLKDMDISFEELKTIMSKHVTITDSQLVDGSIPNFAIKRPEDEKKQLADLRTDPFFTDRNLKILIRELPSTAGEKQIVTQFYYWENESVKQRFQFKKIRWNILLYIATFVTVSLAGWSIIQDQYTMYEFQGNLALDIFLFTLSLMAILTIHEMGHFLVSMMKKVNVTLPYFIPVPSIPGFFQTLGTFGAVIQQKEIVATRDDLFDIGFAGPIAGFLATIPVMIIGLKLTYVVDVPSSLPEVDITQVPTILLFDAFILFGAVTGIIPYFDVTTQTIVQHPVLIAGYIGLILTGINLMPAGQLDGGHTTRAVFGNVPHRIMTLVAALLLALNPSTRYFGILVLVMSMFQGHPGPNDDVTPVHWSKYVLITLGFIIGIVCLPLPINLIASWI